MTSPTVVYVVGSGIIGLTTALTLQRSLTLPSPRVHIFTLHPPTSSGLPSRAYDLPYEEGYVSSAAGAHHLSSAQDEDARQRWLEARTLDCLWDESEEGAIEKEEGRYGIGVQKVRQTEWFTDEGGHLEFLEGMPDFRELKKEEIPERLKEKGIKHAVQFTTLSIEPQTYLSKLWERFFSLGGTVHERRVGDINEIPSLLPGVTPSFAVICTGLGSSALAGLEDKTVLPTRGQTVILDAPWCREGSTFQIGAVDDEEGGRRFYIIPREDGEVVLGGTREKGDTDRNPRPETTTSILKGCLTLGGASLFPPGTPLNEVTVEKLRKLVKREVVGFRPTRKDGIRIEKLSTPFPLYTNYGHGGYGYQSSWASSELIHELVTIQRRPEINGPFRGCLRGGDGCGKPYDPRRVREKLRKRKEEEERRKAEDGGRARL